MSDIFLIDYENVNRYGVEAIKPTPRDTVIIMFTENSHGISLTSFENIDCRLKVIRTASGKQSLDMHLVSYLGFMVKEKGTKAKYNIVSNDSDFDKVVSFWKGQGIDIVRTPVNLYAAANPVPQMEQKSNIISVNVGVKKQKTVKQILNEQTRSICNENGLTQLDGGEVCHIVLKFHGEEDEKEKIKEALAKKFGQEKGAKYFEMLKENA